WSRPAQRLLPSNRALRQYLQAWGQSAGWRRDRQAANRPSPAYHAARTMAVGHVQWRGHRCYTGPDWSRSDPLVQYGIGLPFGGLRSWTHPMSEFCPPRADFRTPPLLERIRCSEPASAANTDRGTQYRDERGFHHKRAPWHFRSPDRLPPWRPRRHGHADRQSRL